MYRSPGGSVHRRIIKVAVPIGTFVAGVLAQLLLDRLTNKSIDTPTRIMAAAIGGLAIVVVILIIVVAFDYVDRMHQINSISVDINGLTQRFGLSVEFMPDRLGRDDGMTYERTRQLISRAQRSLVFVDFYTESGSYRSARDAQRSRRRSYYSEILRQIDVRSHDHRDGTPFHRRMIQVDLAESGGQLSYGGDDSFTSYLQRCLVYQEDSAKATVTKVCPPLVYMHFAIIDDRYVILPILTAVPLRPGIRRHGALIFEDLVGDLVKTLMNIYEMLDATAQPLTSRQIEQSA
jgi:hypothetical protein